MGGRATRPRGALRVALADELAPSLRAGTRRVRVARARRRLGRRSRTTIRPTRRGRFAIHELDRARRGPARAGGAPGRPANLPVGAAGPTRRSAPRRGRAAHQPGPHPRGRAALRPGPRRRHRVRPAAGVLASTTSSAASTGRPPPAPARPIVRTYRAERNQTVLLPARQRARHGRPGRRRAPGRARHGRGDDAHRRRTRLGDRAGLRRVRPNRARGGATVGGHATSSAASPRRCTTSSRSWPRATTGPRSPRRWPASGAARARGPAHRAHRARRRRDAAARAAPDGAPPPRRRRRRAGSRGRGLGAGQARSTRPSAYRKAAAVGALDERRRAIARLQGMGATVVDATPGRLAPQLADAYLKVKATGRL